MKTKYSMQYFFFVTTFLFGSVSLACKVTSDHSSNWRVEKVAEKSNWIVEGKVFEEIRQDDEVQYIILPKTVFKGKKELSYRTGFFRHAGKDESLPWMDLACRFNVKLKVGKTYIFLSFTENKMSVMDAADVHRDLIKKLLQGK
ncbi:hypothetical protein [Bdellovibrio bacteriovorus]|uniref:hypothetical protein n=1 Tax=Bdellovibrio bacteriovorus TaxID=959 RepID=UPI0035A88568